MMGIVFLSLLFALVAFSYEGDLLNEQFAPGIVPQKCLECICQTESGCKPAGCHWDETSYSCGYFQIKRGYWEDCGRPGKYNFIDIKTKGLDNRHSLSLAACADDINCSSLCVQKYMFRYAKRSECPATCETYAREHNGGPFGCRHNNTLSYWKKVQSHGCK